jgi:hypothetical protein
MTERSTRSSLRPKASRQHVQPNLLRHGMRLSLRWLASLCCTSRLSLVFLLLLSCNSGSDTTPGEIWIAYPLATPTAALLSDCDIHQMAAERALAEAEHAETTKEIVDNFWECIRRELPVLCRLQGKSYVTMSDECEFFSVDAEGKVKLVLYLRSLHS